MTTIEPMPAAQPDDLELVSQCLAGNRDAFAWIVARYQNLICSIAYSATGSLSQSQDLSQETFVLAWNQLPELREPGKLRSWLCAIARNRIHKMVRRQGHDPVHAAETLEAAHDIPAHEMPPSAEAISKDEEAILWRSLERISESYRTPLILFYREHRSVEKVAEALELSEEAVRQRLSRGRKLLNDQVLAFVEGALEKTSPDGAFMASVMGALPIGVASVKGAAIATALGTGGAAAKGALSIGLFGSIFAVLGGVYLNVIEERDDTKSPREKQFITGMIGLRIFVIVVAVAAFIEMPKLDLFKGDLGQDIFKASAVGAAVVIATGIFGHTNRRRMEIQIEDGTFAEEEWKLPRRETDKRPVGKLRVLRMVAVGLAWLVFLAMPAPWSPHPLKGLFWVAVVAGCVYWNYRKRQVLPRYNLIRPFNMAGVLLVAGAITLFAFNFNQYLAHKRGAATAILPPETVIVFNAIVASAYGISAGLFFWKSRKSPSIGGTLA